MSTIPGIQSIDKEGWLSLLAEPNTLIRFNFQGVPARLKGDAGWDTGERRLDEHLIYFIAENRCNAVIEGSRFSIHQGTLCWVRPGTKFRFYCGANEAIPPPLIYRFRFRVELDGIGYQPEEPWCALQGAWACLDLIKQLVREAEYPSLFTLWRVRNLTSLLSIAFFEADSPHRSSGGLLSDAQREALITITTDHPESRLSSADLARHLGFSTDYFARIFRRTYQTSPRTWLLRQRLQYAATLLRESRMRISEVAERLGYSESYLFTRQFHNQYGMSPSQWRKIS